MLLYKKLLLMTFGMTLVIIGKPICSKALVLRVLYTKHKDCLKILLLPSVNNIVMLHITNLVNYCQ